MKISSVICLLPLAFITSSILVEAGNLRGFRTDKGQISSSARQTDTDHDQGVTQIVQTGVEPLHHDNRYLENAVQALDVMQSQFYELWIGTWPTSIDWTGAVVNTHVSAILGTIARYNDDRGNLKSSEIIHRYFSHNIAYYFGEEAFSIRNEAFDDMLWVVLGWLESVKFIDTRNLTDATWHGTQFIPAFAHRARIFWDLASRGWDTKICGGGMVWNPRLTPYKNAITNQLFISASTAMYLYFPGDTNDLPYLMSDTLLSTHSAPGRAYDPKYLEAAVKGYAWLKNSNMTNSQGLYVDGFHVKNWGRNGGIGTGKCDERNDFVYTYNQGVILSGLRGLWEATGDQEYLDDGYELVRNVMMATGWSEDVTRMSDTWSGLGSAGILEELCDRTASCSQDGQTFKGIFFQHLAQFCMPLPRRAVMPGRTYGANKQLAALHEINCLVISAWVKHNAEAAMQSRDGDGLFGAWWGKPSLESEPIVPLPSGAQDYRNNATILSLDPWVTDASVRPSPKRDPSQRIMKKESSNDINDRGRGRTVETQGGGLAVLRAAWELSRNAS